jgi:hypothetical protein
MVGITVVGNNVGIVVDGENDEGESVGNNDVAKTVGVDDGGSVGDMLGDAVGAAEFGTDVVCAAIGHIDGNNIGIVVDGTNDGLYDGNGKDVGHSEGDTLGKVVRVVELGNNEVCNALGICVGIVVDADKGEGYAVGASDVIA